MRSFISTAAIALAASSLVSAVPTRHSTSSSSSVIQLPLGDGFPTPSDAQIQYINSFAKGTLSNLPPPGKLSDDSLISLSLVAFNELFEVFFFANFLKLLEEEDQDFLVDLKELKVDLDTLKSSIQSIVAVEELHMLNANNALKKLGGDKFKPIQPCKYKFLPKTVKEAVILANRFTNAVEGALQDAIFEAASAGDAGLTVGIASSAEDEGEQNGGFNLWLGLDRPQSQPFHTRAVRDYAFSILQDFIEPGSCPNEEQIDLQVFQPLTADDPTVDTKYIDFTFSLKPSRFDPSSKVFANVKNFAAKYNKGTNWKQLSITYLNGQNIISEPLKSFNFDSHSQEFTVSAYFPQKENQIFGLAIAVLTLGNNFTSAADVRDATLFGPAPLQVQEK